MNQRRTTGTAKVSHRLASRHIEEKKKNNGGREKSRKIAGKRGRKGGELLK